MRWVVGVGVAAAVGGAALIPLVAGAQPPPGTTTYPNAHVLVGCPLPSSAAVTRVDTGGAVAGVRLGTDSFAADLARALGKTQEEVERALERVEQEMPPEDQVVVVGVIVSPDAPTTLQPVAQRLGVSVDELTAAMKSAGPPCPTDGPSGAPTMATRFEPEKLFDAIAAELGRGITGDQVRAAFDALQPPAGSVQTIAFNPAAVINLEALAEALGVTLDELRAALESIAPRPLR